MKVMGYTPDVRTFNSLLEACKRSRRTQYAEYIVTELMPASGVTPDTQTWNTLLGAFGRNGDMDGAYRIWQVGDCLQANMSFFGIVKPFNYDFS